MKNRIQKVDVRSPRKVALEMLGIVAAGLAVAKAVLEIAKEVVALLQS
jgi:hypothetical protein